MADLTKEEVVAFIKDTAETSADMVLITWDTGLIYTSEKEGVIVRIEVTLP